jgi:NitT/TauT family transport system permease protein
MRRWAAPILVLFALLSIWESLYRLNGISPYLFCSPSQMVQCLFFDAEELFGAFLWTALCGCAGFLLSALLGTAIGTCLYVNPWAHTAFYPFAVVFQTVPIIAIAPILVIWLGYGAPTVVASALLASLFPVIMATLNGLAAANGDLRDLFRLYRASRWAVLTKLLFPMALPTLLTGFRIAAGLAVIGAIVGEFVGGGGLGSVVDAARTQQRLDKVFAAVFLASALGDDMPFTATVTAIDPAEKVIQGVVFYQATLMFTSPDVQMVKPGMSANVTIETARKEGVLYLPQRSVLEEDGKKFVRVPNNSEDPSSFDVVYVTTGLRANDGLLEIVSGVSEGQTVILTIKNP